jgi:peptide-methionine (R)-S-oxide reductase
MMTRRGTLALGGAGLALLGFGGGKVVAETFEVTKTPEEWRAILSPAAYAVLREEDTENAGSSPLDHEKRAGTFFCAGCDLALYSSKAKYDSGTGWPSFFEPMPNAVGTKADRGILGTRTEVHCRRCGGHLGHVFNDGPEPTGKRYCMNGVAMVFRAA